MRTSRSLTAVWLALSRGWMESVKLWWMATERQRGGGGGHFLRCWIEEKVQINWSFLYSPLSILIVLNRLWINSWMWSLFEQTGRTWHEGGADCVCEHCGVTKWEWNGTAGLKKKKSERIGFQRNEALWVTEEKKDGGMEAAEETDDAGNRKALRELQKEWNAWKRSRKKAGATGEGAKVEWKDGWEGAGSEWFM